VVVSPVISIAEWLTKENRQTLCTFLHFSGPRKKNAGMAPNGAGSFFFFRANPDLANILGHTEFDFEICFWVGWVPSFWLGPSLGPPTWVPYNLPAMQEYWVLHNFCNLYITVRFGHFNANQKSLNRNVSQQ